MIVRTIITPQRAEEILERNIINRTPNMSNVGFLVEEILNDRFIYNGATIKLSNDKPTPILLDGQHRLMACIEAKTNIEVELVEGISFDAMSTIDTGRLRNHNDILSMNGVSNPTAISSLANTIITKFKTDRIRGATSKSVKRAGRVKVPGSVMLDFYHDKKEMINEINEFSTHLYNTGTKIISTCQIGAFIYLFGYEDTTDGKKPINFFREVMFGVDMGKSNIAKKLRDRLINDKISSRRMPARVKRNLIIKGWRLYNADVVRKTFTMRDEESLSFAGDDVFATTPNIDVEYMKKIYK